MTIRFIGQCQICETNYKIVGGLVALHGYKRPGDGRIHDRCAGEGSSPYETSCHLIPPWLSGVEQEIAHALVYQAELRAGRVTTIQRPTHSRKVPFKEIKKSEVTPREWEIETIDEEKRVDYHLQTLRRDADHLRHRIRDWRSRPLQEVDEQGRTKEQRQASAERSSERAKARDDKDAKRVELARKRAQTLLDRKVILDNAGTLLRSYAARGQRDEALKLMKDLGKKKNRPLLQPSFAGDSMARLKRSGGLPLDLPDNVASSPHRCVAYLWEQDIHANDAMVALGLATRDPSRASGGEYKHELWA